jgi:hypothetical protein
MPTNLVPETVRFDPRLSGAVAGDINLVAMLVCVNKLSGIIAREQ